MTTSSEREHDDSPVREQVPRNRARLVLASALQSTGDQAVSAKAVLP